jgi:hypothetical protein
MPRRVTKIVSGGQTGVDRGALDAAIACGVEHGGWCPKERRAEDGRIPERYRLVETASPEYAVRTERNVRDTDGTLVLTVGTPSGGTALTCELATAQRRPCLVVDLATASVEPEAVRRWIDEHGIRVLNVAGPRESMHPGIQTKARNYVRQVLECSRSPKPRA